jgi:hypothetical protein
MKRLLVLFLFVAIVVSGFAALFTTIDSADAQQVKLPPLVIKETIRAEPGSEHFVGSIDIPDEFIGQICDVTIVGANNESVHPKSNIVLRGGTTEVVFENVESVPGKVLSGSARVTVVASQIDVFVQLGPDGVFSGAATAVTAVCIPGPPPETTTTATTSTTVVPPRSTTVPGLPVGLPHTL